MLADFQVAASYRFDDQVSAEAVNTYPSLAFVGEAPARPQDWMLSLRISWRATDKVAKSRLPPMRMSSKV